MNSQNALSIFEQMIAVMLERGHTRADLDRFEMNAATAAQFPPVILGLPVRVVAGYADSAVALKKVGDDEYVSVLARQNYAE